MAGAVGFLGNEIAAQIRLRAGRRLKSPALIADGNTRASTVSASSRAQSSSQQATIGDPIVGLLITLVILKITWDSWRIVRHSRGAWDETT